MFRISVRGGAFFLLACCILPMDAQQPAAASANVAVPPIVNFSGVLTDVHDKPLTGAVGVTFYLYQESQGGAPLWMETQNVRADKAGHYTAALGSTSSQGLPANVFASGEARWLGVQPQGQEEQPRVLLVSVPYALKALDAQTLGGKPASAFATALPSPPASRPDASNPTSALTGSGTPNHIAKWITSTRLGSSGIFETVGGNVGIGTTAPTAKFDLKGAGDIRDTLTLFPAGSHSTLSISGTAFQINSKGTVAFVSGQTFPGTVTSVTAGTDLTGGGKGPNVTVNLDTTKVPQLNTANSFKGNQSVTGNVSATGLVSAATLSGNGAALTNVNAATLNGLPSNSFALVTKSNTFPADQVFNGNGKQMIVGDPGCGAGFAAIGFGALSACNNYSLLGDGTNTYINRPTGGTLYIREGNGNELAIAPGGSVSITSSLGFAPALSASSTGAGGEGNGGMQAVGGGGSSEFLTGGYGVLAEGGSESNTSTFGGDGVDAYAGTADQGGVGVLASGGASRVVGGGDGIDALAGTGPTAGYSGFFSGGDVNIQGNLGVSGQIFAGIKDFKIDHPLDPANKYLYHASVESSEMMNIYTGNVSLDGSGAATVELPEWFEAVNGDFRYQLTAIGAAAPNLHIAQEVANHQFGIAGGAPAMKVSWQVTGVRHDAIAQANPLVVEVDKPANERGFYLHPALYGQPEDKQIEWGRSPAKMRRLKDRQAGLVKRAQVGK